MAKPILVVTHERSGTHLLINMINYKNKGAFYSVGVLEEYEKHDLETYKYKVKKDIDIGKYRENVVFKSHHQIQFYEDDLDFLFENYHVIYLKREIKDVLISYYKFLNSDKEHKLIKNFPKFEDWIFMNPKEVGYKYFAEYPDPHIIIEPFDYVDRILLHIKGWEKYNYKFLTVTYEDILTDYKQTKEKIENYIGDNIADKIPDINDKELPNIYHNKGIIGAYREYMNENLIEKINMEIDSISKK